MGGLSFFAWSYDEVSFSTKFDNVGNRSRFVSSNVGIIGKTVGKFIGILQ